MLHRIALKIEIKQIMLIAQISAHKNSQYHTSYHYHLHCHHHHHLRHPKFETKHINKQILKIWSINGSIMDNGFYPLIIIIIIMVILY